MDEKRDIFQGKFGGETESPRKSSLSQGLSDIGKGSAIIARGLGSILFRGFRFNILFLVLIVILAILGGRYVIPNPTGHVVYQNITSDCPVCEVCEECQECAVCTECEECPVCEGRIVYRYRCSDGRIVDESSECEIAAPDLDTENKAEANGITLAVTGIEQDQISITKINYTIINQGNDKIQPVIIIKVYDEWSSEVIESSPKKTIRFTEPLEQDDWIIRSDTLVINLKPEDRRLRLELRDESVIPSVYVTAVAMDFR